MLMTPNRCQIAKRVGSDAYGQFKLGAPVGEPCAVVRNRSASAQTSIRASQSASEGYALHFLLQNRFLLGPTTVAAISDQLIFSGMAIQIDALEPCYDTFGTLDHYVVEGSPCPT